MVKADIAKFIREGNHSYSDWVEFQKHRPEIRLKKVAKSGVLMNLSENSGFIDPESWLNNYEAGQKIHFERALAQALESLGNTKVQEILKQSKVEMITKDEGDQLALDVVRHSLKIVLSRFDKDVEKYENVWKVGHNYRGIFVMILSGYFDFDELKVLSNEDLLSFVRATIDSRTD